MKIKNFILPSEKILAELKKHALEARRTVIKTSAKAGSVHIASSLSPIDILIALYFDSLRFNSREPGNPKNDRFILSKGHGALGLYCVLIERGLLSEKLLEKYNQNDSILATHPVRGSAPWIEVSTGSLGHGLSIGLGLALAQKSDHNHGRTFVLVSEGDCDEGSTWEAAMLAGHLGVENLTVIVDYNKIQCFGSVKEVLDLEPFADKWRADHWAVEEIDGHDFNQLIPALRRLPLKTGHPTVIIANTIKGKGVPFMENKLEWHHRTIKMEELNDILTKVY
jgi:transketolase